MAKVAATAAVAAAAVAVAPTTYMAVAMTWFGVYRHSLKSVTTKI